MSLRLTSSALALVAFASPALADVTPDEVWESLLTYYKSSGYTVTEGSRDLAGETLSLKDVKFAVAVEGKNEGADFTVPSITLQSTGDGKVRTVYADQFPVNLHGTDPETEKPYDVSMTVAMPGNETVTSGAAGDMTHDMKLPELTVTLDKLSSSEEAVPVKVKFTATNSTGTMHTVTGSDAKYDSAMKSEKAVFEVGFEQEGEGKLNLVSNMANLEFTANMVGMVEMANMQTDLGPALEKGLAINGMMKAGLTDFTFDFAKEASEENGTPAQSAAGKGNVQGFDLAFNMSKDGIGYQVNSDKSEAELTSSDLPFPVRYALGGSSFDLQLPVAKSDEPAPFKMAYSINELTIGDEIWNLFDPTKQLPRDPASLDVDLTGSVKMLKSLFDPTFGGGVAAVEETTTEDATGGTDTTVDEYVAEEPPFVPVEVNINQLALSAVGAKVSANGALKPSEANGFDAPVGKINARYEGVNGLLDKLGKMGLIPEDQMAGARMMLAMFARPGDGADVLTTEIEFKEDGSVLANGQQVK